MTPTIYIQLERVDTSVSGALAVDHNRVRPSTPHAVGVNTASGRDGLCLRYGTTAPMVYLFAGCDPASAAGSGRVSRAPVGKQICLVAGLVARGIVLFGIRRVLVARCRDETIGGETRQIEG